MQGKPRISEVLMVLAVLLAAAGSMAAQQKPKRRPDRGRIFLIARMPETLTMGLNKNIPQGSAASSSAFDSSKVPSAATSMTSSWVLARGRSQIVTWSQVKRPAAPAIIALVIPSGIHRYSETFTDSPLGYGLATSVSNKKLEILNITDANRAAASTVSLSESLQTIPAVELTGDAYLGTMKIQVQAIP